MGRDHPDWIVRPGLGQIQSPVDEGMAVARHIATKRPRRCARLCAAGSCADAARLCSTQRTEPKGAPEGTIGRGGRGMSSRSDFGLVSSGRLGFATMLLSLIHISEPTRLGMISYAV